MPASRRHVLAGCLASAVVILPAPSALAAQSSPVQSSRSVATLVTDTDQVAPGTPLHAGLRLRLAPGWHTYWQNPGDAGIPPTIDLALSPGTHAGNIEWPVPQKLAEGTLTTYAYTGDVVLPFAITPGDGPLSMKAHAEWLVCRDICVPEQADLEIGLPVGQPAQSAEATLIATAIAHVPVSAPFSSTLASDGALTLSGISVTPASAEFFPALPGAVNHAKQQKPSSHDHGLSLTVDTALTAGQTTPGVIVLTDGAGRVSAFSITPKAVLPQQPLPLLGPLLLLALAGGLLLNLMPCVFPVLAMKAMAIARMSGADMRRIRREAASYGLGVVTSFTALGAALILLRAAGLEAGWGFQFQSPTFVMGMAWLLFAIGLSLSGVFVVGAGLIGRGQALSERGGHLGSFLTGVLAVVVASPCTAPFMGTAIAGALALPSPAALAVFAALGVGLAMPYGLIATVPHLSRMLPRPGAWMVTLQQLLAFPLYAAAAWLVWVLSQQAGPPGVLTAGIGLVVVAMVAWTAGLAHAKAGWGAHLARLSAASGIMALAALLYTGTASPTTTTTEPFTEARLEQLRTEGRPVFVNMTASWCLSCLVNEKLALSPKAVQQAFTRAHVAYLKGDWTSQSPAISAFLHQLGQDGVPLYVLYAPGRSPVVLPQILSEAAVLEEVAKLGS